MRFWSRLAILYCLKAVLVSGYEFDADYLIPPKCQPCDAKSCPQLTFCAGKRVKDNCGCCPRCSSDLFQPHPRDPQPPPGAQLPSDATEVDENKADNPCDKRQCPKFKVCMINVQGLPICTCPSSYVCKNHGKKGKPEEVCGSDGITYDSRCHLRIASCNSARRIKRKHDGECTKEDLAEINAIERQVEKNKINQIDFGSNTGTQDAEYLAALNRAKKRRLRQKKKQDKKKKRKRKKQRKERSKKRGNKRQKRMKRRNEGYNMYSKRYGYLIGRNTRWSKSQIRKSRI
ncbi:follistatin-like [Mercenaria mercenaria]|uniref:follistatin-like n=1 Tax=Mercenaria mercenaria TaxID=6596 RepID=UPI00234F2A41|nr:follistatin-like [Mercenaria mercenaria]